MILLFFAALGGDMDTPAVVPLAAAVATAVPPGPPVHVRVAAGEDVNARLQSLPAGSTVQLLPGDHAGPIVVDRPLTLRGPARVLGPGRGSVILVLADDVTVEGLEVTGSGLDATAGDAGVVVAGSRARIRDVQIVHTFLGVDLRASHHSEVRGCTIFGREEGTIGTHGDGVRLWESDDNVIVDNRLEHVRDMVVWYSERNRFEGNEVTRSRYGVHLMHADDTVLRGNRFVDDVVGVFAMYSAGVHVLDNLVLRANGPAGMGIGLKESDRVTVAGNRLLASTTGLYLDSTPHRSDSFADVRDNLIAYDHVGVRFHGVHPGAVFAGNDLHENHTQVRVDGGGQAAAAEFSGNRWSDYVGYDLDRDGIGDLPYAPRSLARSVVDRRPAAGFFDGTPAAALLDLLAAAFPMWSPPPLITDPRPRLGRLELR